MLACFLLACGGDDDGGGTDIDAGDIDAGDIDAGATVTCPACGPDEICLVTCDGDMTPNDTATCVPNPLGCSDDPPECTADCEESLCGGEKSPYSCSSGVYCSRADTPAFYCQGV
ncbi:MAG TPA: hypothetical protein VNO33_02395 [Kofleriaceae bacterium]|nr:hypothetical protein [Kofleriaceae bacterium]